MVSAVEEVADQLLATRKAARHYGKNIALEAHQVVQDTFAGMTCSAWLDENKRVYQENMFECSTAEGNNVSGEAALGNRVSRRVGSKVRDKCGIVSRR